MKSKPLSLFFILAMIAAAALLVFATPTTAGKFSGDIAKGVVATKPRCCGAIIGRAKLLGSGPLQPPASVEEDRKASAGLTCLLPTA
nr:hypothetical protein Iba_chr08eCG8270 [Ipomoea batatas]